MAITRLTGQDNQNTNTSTTVTSTYPGATTSGNLLIMALYVNAGVYVAPTGWTEILSNAYAGSNKVYVYAKIADGTETGFTSSYSSGTNSTLNYLQGYEYSGAANPLVVETSNSRTGASVTTLSTGSITTAITDDLLIAVFSANNTTTAHSVDSSFNLLQTSNRLATADYTPAATGTYNPAWSWTTSRNVGTGIIAIQPAAVSGGPSKVQTLAGNGGGYVNSYTISVTPTAGNTLTLCMAYGAADTITITDNKSNSWVLDKSQLLTGQRQSGVWRASNVASGATTITVQANTGQYPDSAYILDEWSGLATTTQPDATTGANTTSGTTYAAGSVTTTQASEILVGAIAVDSSTPSYTGDASWTGLQLQAGSDLYTSVARQYRIPTSTGTYSWTITSASSRQAAQSVVAYKTSASTVTNTSNFFF